MIRDHYLKDAIRQLRKSKELADRAIAQVGDDGLFFTLDSRSNSIAIIMKHMAGNMRSRWRDFLTSDGEKPDRHRDREFELDQDDTADNLRAAWAAGWRLTIETLSGLDWRDLESTVTIRGEPHTVLEAIQRQLTHYAYHVGQIVLLARHQAGDGWRWLSIPPGRSADFEVSKDGDRYST